MKISYNWLKQFVDLKVSPQKLADDLSLFGHQVEKIVNIGKDYILDFEITSNRGDLLSIYGMARETAALYNKNFKFQISNFKFKEKELNKRVDVKISDPKVCPRFTARIIDNIKIKESPEWIKDKLKSYGFRPLNNIVDITNLVMIETGQPLHVFDYDKIDKGKMIIRLAKEGESVITLDGKNRQLDEDAIIMDDGKKIFDLCGIMGGYNSEVDKNTKTIILQGSIFDPVLIRRTSKKLKLMTDASYRFERAVDWEGTVSGVDKATQLIVKDSPLVKIGKLIDIKSLILDTRKIKIDIGKINNLLGTELSQSTIVKYLKRLNINCMNRECIIPSYREYDLTIWQDLAEEVARIHGYNNLGINIPLKTKSLVNLEYDKKQYIKDLLVENGFTEVYSYSFTDKRLLEELKYNLSDCRKVINGLTPETEYLRPTLIPSIITTIGKNPWAPEVSIFELGKVFNKSSEKWQLGVATTSKVYNLNTILWKLFGYKEKDSQKVISNIVLDYLKIRRQVKYIIVDLDEININLPNDYKWNYDVSKKYKKVSEFPPTVRDLAFIVDEKIDSQKVNNSIEKIDSHILLVELFDEFTSDKFGKDKKNIAYHIWLQDLHKPMDEKNTNKIVNMIIRNIKKKYNAKLRTK